MWTPVEGEIAEIETELEEITTRMPHAEPGLIEK
jgi:hypothetical protein